MKKVIALAFCWLLVSCSSAPLSVNHYLLHTPNQALSGDNNDVKSVVIFEQVWVADYLRQASLIIQVNEHELYFSRQDIWAEALQSSFYKALKYDLNSSASHQYVADYQNSDSVLTLKVVLEHFHITDDSTVISSGTYQLLKKDTLWLEKPFHFTAPLKKDGYPHAVSQQRKTVKLLAQQISQDIDELQNK